MIFTEYSKYIYKNTTNYIIGSILLKLAVADSLYYVQPMLFVWSVGFRIT